MATTARPVATTEPVSFPFAVIYRWIRPALLAAAAVVVVLVAIQIFVSVYTSSAWYSAVGEHSVFTRKFLTQLVLALIVGGAAAASLLASGLLAYRLAIPAMTPAEGKWSLRYRRYWHRRRRLLLLVASVIAWLVAGLGAAGNWQLWLGWRNAVPFGRTDAQFHRDAAYFVFTYPFERFLVSTAVSIVEIALFTAIAVAILCGVLRRRRHPLPASMLGLFSVLFGVLYVVKAAAYWLDRFSVATTSDNGIVTGASYTDVHALLPAKFALLVLALVAAVALFVNAVLRRWWLLVISVGGMIAAGIVLGGIYPALVQQFSAKPNALSAERTPIARNIAATRYAFGLDGSGATTTSSLASQPTAASVTATAAALQARILDPNREPPTFTQLQQERSVYGFKSTLDVDHYPVSGKERDLVVGVRELTIGSLPSGQQTWDNQHLVYTHGYGVVAAPLDTVDPQGEPAFVESGLPPKGVLGQFQPRIYFGQKSPAYSVVDGPGSARRAHELDLPAVGGGQQTATTYRGRGGVPIGSLLRQLSYAWKFRDPNIVLSSQVGAGSKLLYIRDPRARVAAVAPWLTLDSDAYPVVEGGRVVWVVDGYTTSSSYPAAQEESFRSATTNTFTTNGALSPQSGQVNYIRNSVKATVDAYDGTVTLYAWDQQQHPDPVLRTWERAFPGLVKPQSAIPAALLSHLRYPQDLFNLQRQVLTSYHVSAPAAFYNGSDFWKVPTDPTVSAKGSSAPLQPSYYTTYDDGSGSAAYALTTSFTTLNRRALAAWMAVDAQPGPDYGRITVLEVPGDASAQAPGQIQNDIESDPQVAQQLTLLRGGGSKVVLGNLQSVPIGGQMLYVEPIYERAAGGTSFPILHQVVAVYGHRIAYDTSLPAALKAVLQPTSSHPLP